MKIILGLVLACSIGCAGSAKTTTPVPCTPWGCGTNGTQTTGTVDQTPAVVEMVTLPTGEVVK